MTVSIEIDGPNVRASVRNHECGKPMICFSPFRIAFPTGSLVLNLIDKARSTLKPLEIIRIRLDEDQTDLRMILEDLGFALDGIEYQFIPFEVKAALNLGRLRLPTSFSVRQMIFEQDIQAVVYLEREIHAADPTSRVNFDSDEAVAGMTNYYRRCCDDDGAFVLMNAEKNVSGIVGFMPDRSHPGSTHISSVGLATAIQGGGLFFAFLFEALSQAKFSGTTSLTGTTTTKRLIEAAQRYPIRTLGSSWSHLGDAAAKSRKLLPVIP